MRAIPARYERFGRQVPEWLLLLGFFAIVVGIALPAISKIREAERKHTCLNNLKQIGLTLMNHRDTMNGFPAATMRADDLPPEKRLSWHVAIVPFIEAGPDRLWGLEPTKPWDAENNIRFARDRYRIYLCPANSNQQRDGLFFTHYVGMTGIGEDSAWLTKEDVRAGFFGFRRWIDGSDITDGTSTTLAAVETNTENGPWVAGGNPTVRAYLGRNDQFGGLHRHVVNTLFADATCRSLKASIDPKVFEALATIAGGEPVDRFEAD